MSLDFIQIKLYFFFGIGMFVSAIGTLVYYLNSVLYDVETITGFQLLSSEEIWFYNSLVILGIGIMFYLGNALIKESLTVEVERQ